VIHIHHLAVQFSALNDAMLNHHHHFFLMSLMGIRRANVEFMHQVTLV
jgi:hypothetical protein